MNKIIVIEDNKPIRDTLVKHLRSRLKDKAIITIIDGVGERELNETYEDLLEKQIKMNAPEGALIVCDKDLSTLGEQFIGLSGTTVAGVSDNLGFPLCLYARGEAEVRGEELLKSLAPWEKKRIILEFKTEKELAKECASIFKSFSEIRRIYDSLRDPERATPAAALSRVLNQPGIEDRVALYGSGEQGLLAEIMPFYKATDGMATKLELTKRMPRILGNWLYTSILRFPGILVSDIPAASYLNIDPNDFKKFEIRKLFEKAKYKGPFAELSNWWWRHLLDAILERNDCDDGLTYASQKGYEVAPCLDPQTKDRAGYYCMVTTNPVSVENSKGGISWFPSGSDLARIRKDKFDELAPWIGLY